MLIDIRNYMKERKVCSLADLSMKFKTSPDAMRGMLSHWERKGYMVCETSQQCGSGGGCKTGCGSCDASELEVYRWKGKTRAAIPMIAVH